MIVFDLRCRSLGHVFEGWFGSTGDYDDQQQRGLVQCPICGAPDVEKAVMAPNVSAKGNRRAAPSLPAESAAMKEMLAALAAIQRKILASSEHVGDRFADEARAIHLGEANARAIHGKATQAETESLIEEGIAVAPLPFPVLEPGEEN